MRKGSVIVLASLLALGLAGVAVAKLKAVGIAPTTATFSAAKERVTVRTCTGNGDEYVLANGWYTGTATFASPNADLGGPIRIHASSVYNKTDGVGWVRGTLSTRDDGRRFHGRFVATLGAGGALEGFFDGRVNRRYSIALGGLSATFDGNTGFVDGKLGNASTSLPAVLAGRPCGETAPPPISVRLVVKGTVEAVSSSSISVKPRDNSTVQSCAVKAGTSPSTANVAVGNTVEMRCGLVSGDMTLLHLRLAKQKDDD
ncbi:MAG TPA: hypothetical protein VH572_03035 [Gaiella sp.]